MIRLNRILYNLPKVRINRNFKNNKNINVKIANLPPNGKIDLNYSLNKIMNKYKQTTKSNIKHDFNKQIPTNVINNYNNFDRSNDNFEKINKYKIPKRYLDKIECESECESESECEIENKRESENDIIYLYICLLIIVMSLIYYSRNSIMISLLYTDLINLDDKKRIIKYLTKN